VADVDPDTELMLRFRGGDDHAFTEIVHRFQGRIASLAYRYLSSAADAEDIAQEVFLRIYRARETYQPTAKFSTWAHRITVNASLNLIRSRRVRKHLNAEMPTRAGDTDARQDFADQAAAQPPRELEKAELAKIVSRIVDALPERQRTAILLNKYQDLSYEDTADAMELSLPAVKSLLTRARVNIKEALLPYLDSGKLPGGTPRGSS